MNSLRGQLDQLKQEEECIRTKYAPFHAAENAELKIVEAKRTELLENLRKQYPCLWVIKGRAEPIDSCHVSFGAGQRGCFSTHEKAESLLRKNGKQQREKYHVITYEVVGLPSNKFVLSDFLRMDQDVNYFYDYDD